MRRSFLTARWENLVILNYEVPPARWCHSCLAALSSTSGRASALVSLVGIPLRGHAGSRRRDSRAPAFRGGEPQVLRAPSGRSRQDPIVARSSSSASLCRGTRSRAIARLLYNEPYLVSSDAPSGRASTRHRGGDIEYGWRYGGQGVLASALRSKVPRRCSEPRIRSGVHHRALLGVYAAARRRHARVRSRASAVARLDAATRDIQRAGERCSTGRCSARHSPAPPRSAFVAAGSPRSRLLRLERITLSVRHS